jgi:hypothetical protein
MFNTGLREPWRIDGFRVETERETSEIRGKSANYYSTMFSEGERDDQ